MASPFKGDILNGQVALVTGGGSGIGFEITRQLGLHGASVAVMGRRRQVLDAAVLALSKEGIKVRQKAPYCYILPIYEIKAGNEAKLKN
jgi:NAD(P)-dependent dehydrogenase (short-subunit alcohol dehydrogenase family)